MIKFFIFFVLNFVLTFSAIPLFAKVTIIPEVVVEGEAIIENKGDISIRSEALPSSVYVITKEDIEKMSVRHYLDLFRKTPGMITSHYGQGDVADGLGMRGYPSGHGSQVAVFVDGVPLNVPHHSHSHGFSDIGWLAPEMIERIEVIKGPFSALYGDFALGGVINIITKKSDTSPIIGASLGSYGAYRGMATISSKDWQPKPFLFYEINSKDGWRDNSEYKRYNLFNKLSLPFGDGIFSVRLHYVKRDWGAPGYLSVDDVRVGLKKRTDAVSMSDGGDSEYYNLVLNYNPKKGEEGFHGTLYLAKEDHNRFATFPPSPQRLEHNERVYTGWNLLYNYMPMKNLSIVTGTDGRYDDGKLQRFDTVNRQITAVTRNWDVKTLGIGVFAQVQYKPLEILKLTGGLRYDYFDFDITNKVRPANSGTGNTSIMTPRVGMIITPMKDLNIYANKGIGFRTPSAMEMSPPDRDYKNISLKPAKVDTWDIGFNKLFYEKFDISFNYYQTDMERETRVVGPATLTIGKSKRTGYDIEARFYASREIALFTSYSWVKARIKNPAVTGENRITGVPEDYFSAGIEWTIGLSKDQKILLDLYWQRLGKAPLNATGTLQRPVIDRYLAKASYNIKNWTLFAEATHHPEKYASEGQFLSSGVVRYDPKPQWDVTAGVKYKF